MIRWIPCRAIAAAGLLLGAFGGLAAMAQVAVNDEPGVVRLSPAERDTALDSVMARDSELPIFGGGNRQVHGEIGAMIGTGGARGIFGTAAVPLGDTGMAVFSFENSHYGRLR
jgi:hypothetical protein